MGEGMGCGRLELNSTQRYIEANMKMHTRMALNYTGDADLDFLLGMLPHHEAAIEMCDIYYDTWACAPARSVCMHPLPLAEVQELIAAGNLDDVSVMNTMHHICKGHILATQPAEIEWMRAELERRGQSHLYVEKPCGGAEHHHHHGGAN